MTKSRKTTGKKRIVFGPIGYSYRSQAEWIGEFNRIGKAMVSAEDVYHAPGYILPRLRKIFRTCGLTTSTRINYEPIVRRPKLKVTQNFGSTVVNPTKRVIDLPDNCYFDNPREAVHQNQLGYLQTLFNTDDDASTLIGRLEIISDRDKKDIRLLFNGEPLFSPRFVTLGYSPGGFRKGAFDINLCDHYRLGGSYGVSKL